MVDLVGLYIFTCIVFSMIRGLNLSTEGRIEFGIKDYILLPSIILTTIFTLYIRYKNKDN